MIRFIATFLSAIIIVVSTTACAGSVVTGGPAAQDTPGAVRSGIKAILADTVLKNALVGVKIVSLTDSVVVFDTSGSILFHPASTMKLLTSATALHLLPDTFHWTTELYACGEISNGTLKGDIIIQGSGDPLFTVDNVDSLVDMLRTAGIRSVHGELVGVLNVFDDIPWGTGWMWDDEPSPYEPFFAALSVNGNTVRVTVAPGKREGDPVDVIIEPSTGYLLLENHGVTSSDTTLPPLRVTRRIGENTISVEGRIEPRGGAISERFSVRDPASFFLTLFREHCEAAGIGIRGGIRIDTVRCPRFIGAIARPLDAVLTHMNKMSDNLAAEHILKLCAAKSTGRPGTSASGLLLMKEHLHGCGIDTSAMILADGSGVSFYNAVSPDAMTSLLEAEYRMGDTFGRFYETLAIAGVDGTLKNRLRESASSNAIRGKTGTLTGSICLAGYVRTRTDKLLAFSIFINHFHGRTEAGQEIQDRLVRYLRDAW